MSQYEITPPEVAPRDTACRRASLLGISVAGFARGSSLAIVQFLFQTFSFLPVASIPANAADLDELTVVTLSRDGAWGVAMAHSQGPAIAAAIRDCRAMAATPSDCGAQSATTRGGWVVANLCGDHKILATAAAREEAEAVALVRETELRRAYAMAMPPCRRVLTVDPRGAVVPVEAASAHQIDAQREKR